MKRASVAAPLVKGIVFAVVTILATAAPPTTTPCSPTSPA